MLQINMYVSFVNKFLLHFLSIFRRGIWGDLGKAVVQIS